MRLNVSAQITQLQKAVKEKARLVGGLGLFHLNQAGSAFSILNQAFERVCERLTVWHGRPARESRPRCVCHVKLHDCPVLPLLEGESCADSSPSSRR